MRRLPSIAPTLPDDIDIYMVLDDFGSLLGRAWPEVDEQRTDRERVSKDLLEGQYSDPVRIVAFNTAEGWSRDVSEEIADELAMRLGFDEATPSVESFIERHGGRSPIQLPLPLKGAA